MSAHPRSADFDLLSSAVLRDPHEFWQSARQHRVFFYEPMQCWVLTRHEDVARALGDWKTFSSRTLRAAPLTAEARSRMPEPLQRIPAKLMDCAFINLDPPGHTIDRKNAQKAFTRPLVAATEPWIRELSGKLIAGFADRGHAELMEDYAHPLTLGVIGHMVGLPSERLPEFRSWIDDFFGLMEPVRADDAAPSLGPEEAIEGRYERVGDAWAFFQEFLDQRRQRPGDDLASRMVLARNEDGTPAMADEHILTHLLELAAAGSDTTANLIGHMVRHLSTHPELLQEARDGDVTWEQLVEEALRRFAIVTNLMRVTTTDVEIAGETIAAGSVVLVNLPGANSDETQFVDPLSVNPRRENVASHLAFGIGRHFCLGAPLARLEAKCALQDLYDRLEGLSADSDQEIGYHAAVTVRALKSLRVSWRP
jgi:cytochrome P450